MKAHEKENQKVCTVEFETHNVYYMVVKNILRYKRNKMWLHLKKKLDIDSSGEILLWI